ncbi:kinase-like domain-containing protein [Amanita rubescens]|nr:kinase-like domain-containing protein [Amanita rubescens]
MQATHSLSLGMASPPRSRIPSLSTSSSSLASTFSDVSSSFSFHSSPTSASKTHAFFASPFSTRSHSPEPVVRQKTNANANISSTPSPPSNLRTRPSPSELASFRDSGRRPLLDLDKHHLPLHDSQSLFLSPSSEPTPRPISATPGPFFTGSNSQALELRPVPPGTGAALDSVDVDPHISIIAPSLSSSTSASSATSDLSTSPPQTYITGQNTDTTLRLLRSLGHGTFSSVWLAEDQSPLPMSLKAKRNLRELRKRASRGYPSSAPSDAVHVSLPTIETLADVSRNTSLKRLRARVRGTKPSRGNIRLMDGSYLVDERDGEMGGVRIESCDSSDAEDNGSHELGLGANLARVGSLSGKVTTVLSKERNLHRRASSKKSSGRLVAVKLTPRGAGNQRDAEKERVAFVREVEVLRHISHPNITPLLSHLSTPTHYVLVFPYLSGGDLLGFVNSDTMWHKLGEDVLRRIWCELCKAVGWMHGVGLVHRDIKLESQSQILTLHLKPHYALDILLTTSAFSILGPESPRPSLDDLPAPPTPLIRLSDFGLSRFVDLSPNGEVELLMTRCGSEAYAAPELVTGGGRSRLTSAGDSDGVNNNGVYDARETDAWACGVVLYALVARRLPFGEGVAHDEEAGADGNNIAGERGRRIHNRTQRRQWLMRIAKGEYSWPELGNDVPLPKEELIGPRLALSRGARMIVEKLLVRDPAKRARIADIWSDPWMKGMGIDKDIALAITSANAEHDFVDELGSFEHQQDAIRDDEAEESR